MFRNKKAIFDLVTEIYILANLCFKVAGSNFTIKNFLPFFFFLPNSQNVKQVKTDVVSLINGFLPSCGGCIGETVWVFINVQQKNPKT